MEEGAPPQLPVEPKPRPLPPHPPTSPRRNHHHSASLPSQSPRLSPTSPISPRPPLPPTSPRKLHQLPPAGASTYVVQVPRDHVYRVPPPENAYLVEQYLKPQNRRSGCRGTPCFSCISWLLGVLVVILLLLGIIAVLIYVIAKPRDPIFTIDQFSIKEGGPKSKPEYDVRIQAKNPSEKFDYAYLKGGTAVLSHRGSRVAAGKPPAFYQKSGEEPSSVNLVLHSPSSVLPLDIQKALKSVESANGGLPMSLSVEYAVKGRIGGIETWEMKVVADCDLSVRVSAKGSKVLDQDCRVKLQS